MTDLASLSVLDLCRLQVAGEIDYETFVHYGEIASTREQRVLCDPIEALPPPRRKFRAKSCAEPPEDRGLYDYLNAVVMDDPRLNDTARRLIAIIKRICRGRAGVAIWVDQLAAELGVTRRTVQRAQALAGECGYIAVTACPVGPKKNAANRYSILSPAVPSPKKERVTRLTPYQDSSIPLPQVPPPPEGERRVAGRDASARRNEARGAKPHLPAPCTTLLAKASTPKAGEIDPGQLDLEVYIAEHPPPP